MALTGEYEETARRIRKIAREHVKGFNKVGGVAWRAKVSNGASFLIWAKNVSARVSCNAAFKPRHWPEV